MCKRLAQFGPVAELIDTLPKGEEVRLLHPLQPLTSIAPQTAMGLLHAQSDGLVFDQVRWGWCPRWANVNSPQAFAPVDKVTHSPYWKPIWQHRALCPVNGWFEWDAEGTPVHYVRRRDRRACLIAAAGQFPRDGRGAYPADGFVLLAAKRRGGLALERTFRPVVLAPLVALEWIDSHTDKQRAEALVRDHGEPDAIFEWFSVESFSEAIPSSELLRNF